MTTFAWELIYVGFAEPGQAASTHVSVFSLSSPDPRPSNHSQTSSLKRWHLKCEAKPRILFIDGNYYGPTWQCPPLTWWAPPSGQHSPPSPTWTASFPLVSPQQWPLSVFAFLTRFNLNKFSLQSAWRGHLENGIFQDCGLDQMSSKKTSKQSQIKVAFLFWSCWVFHQLM